MSITIKHRVWASASIIGVYPFLLAITAHAAPNGEAPHEHSSHIMSSSVSDRDPNDTSGGYHFNQFPMRHQDHAMHVFMLRADKLEVSQSNSDRSGELRARASYGADFDKLTWKIEGQYDQKRWQDVAHDILWTHAITPFWDSEFGIRHDTHDKRNWFAVGVTGLAPYWFELDATVYLDTAGHSLFNLEGEYELLITQKWILQPGIDFIVYGARDKSRNIEPGVGEIVPSIRLRYEIVREIAPYIGVEHLARFRSNENTETNWVAGVRVWY